MKQRLDCVNMQLMTI